MQNCAQLGADETLNALHTEWRLFEVVIYGDALSAQKLAKRLICGVKHLPLRVRISIVTDTQKAIEAGARKDPTLFIDSKPIIEGLVSAETITDTFINILKETP